jgi:hypothetical protein
MDRCTDCGKPADGMWRRGDTFVPRCHDCVVRERHDRLRAELTKGVQCADCGTRQATLWYKIKQGQWHCESCRDNRPFVGVVRDWQPFGEPGDGALFTEP